MPPLLLLSTDSLSWIPLSSNSYIQLHSLHSKLFSVSLFQFLTCPSTNTIPCRSHSSLIPHSLLFHIFSFTVFFPLSHLQLFLLHILPSFMMSTFSVFSYFLTPFHNSQAIVSRIFLTLHIPHSRSCSSPFPPDNTFLILQFPT